MAGDFHQVEFGSARPAAASQGRPIDAPQAPGDAVLVPLDQWNRILGQLGNIHEAGQQLAEARERMARAETENEFLKERIRDLRGRLDDEPSDAVSVQPVEETPPPVPNEPLPRRRRLQVEFVIPRWLGGRPTDLDRSSPR